MSQTKERNEPSVATSPPVDLQIGVLFAEAWVPVFRYAFMMLRHREDAEDVAAETFRRASEALLRDHGPRGNAMPWLLLIARRLVIDGERRRRLIAWLPLLASDRTPTSTGEISKAELWLWFEQLAAVLPSRQREAVILRYAFDLPDEDIGRIMGIGSAGVRTLVSRALSTLRKDPEML
jgi:RNA polymerase sigma factor (sigma-70 family)